jgi:hypothetical protein
MKTMTHAQAATAFDDAIVWLEGDRAVVVTHVNDDQRTVDVLTRAPGETEAQFQARTVDQVANEPRVVVAGPVGARMAFERTYVAITHRPERLADVEPTILR